MLRKRKMRCPKMRQGTRVVYFLASILFDYPINTVLPLIWKWGCNMKSDDPPLFKRLIPSIYKCLHQQQDIYINILAPPHPNQNFKSIHFDNYYFIIEESTPSMMQYWHILSTLLKLSIELDRIINQLKNIRLQKKVVSGKRKRLFDILDLIFPLKMLKRLNFNQIIELMYNKCEYTSGQKLQESKFFYFYHQIKEYILNNLNPFHQKLRYFNQISKIDYYLKRTKIAVLKDEIQKFS